jgi:hypothetical protein
MIKSFTAIRNPLFAIGLWPLAELFENTLKTLFKRMLIIKKYLIVFKSDRRTANHEPRPFTPCDYSNCILSSSASPSSDARFVV